jgi:NADH-quinone oxidoreductase subunit M
MPSLSLLVFLPLAGAVLLIFIPRDKEDLLRSLALAVAGLAFVLAL